MDESVAGVEVWEEAGLEEAGMKGVRFMSQRGEWWEGSGLRCWVRYKGCASDGQGVGYTGHHFDFNQP